MLLQLAVGLTLLHAIYNRSVDGPVGIFRQMGAFRSIAVIPNCKASSLPLMPFHFQLLVKSLLELAHRYTDGEPFIFSLLIIFYCFLFIIS